MYFERYMFEISQSTLNSSIMIILKEIRHKYWPRSHPQLIIDEHCRLFRYKIIFPKWISPWYIFIY